MTGSRLHPFVTGPVIDPAGVGMLAILARNVIPPMVSGAVVAVWSGYAWGRAARQNKEVERRADRQM